MDLLTHSSKETHVPWNKGQLIGQKAPLKLKDIWAIRIHLKLANRIRDLALFNLAIDSKLRGCDLVKLRVRDISHGDHIAHRATVEKAKKRTEKGRKKGTEGILFDQSEADQLNEIAASLRPSQ